MRSAQPVEPGPALGVGDRPGRGRRHHDADVRAGGQPTSSWPRASVPAGTTTSTGWCRRRDRGRPRRRGLRRLLPGVQGPLPGSARLRGSGVAAWSGHGPLGAWGACDHCDSGCTSGRPLCWWGSSSACSVLGGDDGRPAAGTWPTTSPPPCRAHSLGDVPLADEADRAAFADLVAPLDEVPVAVEVTVGRRGRGHRRRARLRDGDAGLEVGSSADSAPWEYDTDGGAGAGRHRLAGRLGARRRWRPTSPTATPSACARSRRCAATSPGPTVRCW